MLKRVCFWVMVLFAFQIPFCGICQEAFQSKTSTLIQSSAVKFSPVKNKFSVEQEESKVEAKNNLTWIPKEEPFSGGIIVDDSRADQMMQFINWMSSDELITNYDLNGDGEFTEADVEAIADLIGDNFYFFKYDLNGNGKLDYDDVVKLNQILRFNSLSSEDQQALLDSLSTDAATVLISALCERGDFDQAAGLLANMDPAKAAEILSSMEAEDAAKIIASDNISMDSAIEIFKNMDSKTAASILSAETMVVVEEKSGPGWIEITRVRQPVISVEKAGQILKGVGSKTAGKILDQDSISVERAGDILNTIGMSAAFDIFRNMNNFHKIVSIYQYMHDSQTAYD